jgi:nitroreductase
MNEIIKGRRTVHEYLPKKVDERLLLDTLQTSLWAPNHKLTEPTRFYIIDEDTRMKLVDLNLKIRSEKGQNVDVELVKKVKDKYLTPSHLVIISQQLTSDPEILKEDYATISCVVHNISLLLWPHGIGSKWSTGAILKRPELFEILGVNPQKERIEGFIWVGFPANIRPPHERPELSSVMKRLP